MEHAASLATLFYTKRTPMTLQIGVTSQRFINRVMMSGPQVDASTERVPKLYDWLGLT